MTPQTRRDLTAWVGGIGIQAIGFATIDLHGFHPLVDAAVAVPLAIAAVVALQVGLPRPKTVLDEVRALGLSDIDEAEVAQVIQDARARIGRLDESCRHLAGARRDKVAELAATARRIVDGFKDDPSDIKRSRTFLRHYLGGTVELVEKYVRLAEKAEHSDSARQALEKFDQGLDDMAALFQQQLEKNLADDIADFDVHLEVFQTLAKQEGV
jgi:5-bromo-4-chloroindolyl phosphate hydrolysis protein